MRLSYNGNLKQLSRNLRNDMTVAEKIVWEKVRRNNLNIKFARQKVIGNYIVDFYCHKAKLIIELDGDQYYYDKGLRKDAKRDKYLKGNGLKILRFTNLDVFNNIEMVMNSIWNEVGEIGILAP